MKIGIAISVALVAIIAVALAMSLGGAKADPPTSYSSAKMLEAKTLAGLPALVEFAAGDASGAYSEMFTYYAQHKDALNSSPAPAEQSDEAMTLLIKAHEAGTVSSRFIDDQVPLAIMAIPKFGGAPQVLVLAAITRAEDQHGKDNVEQKARAEKTVKAAFALGQTLFEKSRRVPVREMGISIMKMAGAVWYKWAEGTPTADTITRWAGVLNEIDEHWEKKTLVVKSSKLKAGEVRATIGDLIKIAKEDKDESWRIEATLNLGRAKYMPNRGKGNDTAILSALKTLKEDKDPTIAAAAAAAESLTADEAK